MPVNHGVVNLAGFVIALLARTERETRRDFLNSSMPSWERMGGLLSLYAVGAVPRPLSISKVRLQQIIVKFGVARSAQRRPRRLLACNRCPLEISPTLRVTL